MGFFLVESASFVEHSTAVFANSVQLLLLSYICFIDNSFGASIMVYWRGLFGLQERLVWDGSRPS